MDGREELRVDLAFTPAQPAPRPNLGILPGAMTVIIESTYMRLSDVTKYGDC